jgi:hypothetical protein
MRAVVRGLKESKGNEVGNENASLASAERGATRSAQMKVVAAARVKEVMPAMAQLKAATRNRVSAARFQAISASVEGLLARFAGVGSGSAVRRGGDEGKRACRFNSHRKVPQRSAVLYRMSRRADCG